ncbi:redoxin domain-containing protein [Vampirovibrio sp.]|uniref:redoxin domain-containing protein n=1 Tax=Vampirovibrio sp. TaxID=2717857 RepID=UPI003593DB44
MFLPTTLLPIGAMVPDFRLLDHQAHSVGLGDFANQKGTVLLFFASDWLKEDLALLQSYRDAHSQFLDANVQVLALCSLNWEKLFHLGQRLNVSFPLLFDQCCRQSTFYKAAWVPKFVTGRAVYGLDARKKIVFAQKQASPQQVLQAFNS